MSGFEPLPPVKRRPRESDECFQWAQQARRELNLHMRIGYLQGKLEAAELIMSLLKERYEDLAERVYRLEARQ